VTDTTSTSAVLDRPRLPLEAGKVAELVRALKAQPGSVPPTYTVLAAHHTPSGRSPHELVIQAAGLDPARVLLGSMVWVHHRTPRVGSTLEGVVRLTGTTTKQSRQAGSLRIATASVAWQDERGTVTEVSSVLLEPSRPPQPEPAPPGAPNAAHDSLVADDEHLVLTRSDIVRYAGAAGDFNPVHHDHEAARALGYPDVFAMGLLPGGVLACRLTGAADLAGRRLTLAFRGLVWPGRRYTITDTGAGPERTASLCASSGQALVSATVAGATA
jgi:MaoC like domain